ncbi:unannotated protein [freshwater metagenome]|uniref:Unannotated protein n=1 Tax=freshwater metagenome TaxID=449393 RepID=A0A6J7HT76_9ZZZZ|nr:hypothetical protein [Actinomycetota bacterium]
MRTAPLRGLAAGLAGFGLIASGLALATLPSANVAISNATLDPATGSVKSGQGLKIENVSMMSNTGQAILRANSRFTASKWYSNFYVMTVAGKFKVATWWVLGT